MHVFEVESICSVLGDVLHVDVDVVNGLTHVAISLAKLCPVSHLEIWLYFGI